MIDMGLCDEGRERGEAAFEGRWKVGEVHRQASCDPPSRVFYVLLVLVFNLGAGASDDDPRLRQAANHTEYDDSTCTSLR